MIEGTVVSRNDLFGPAQPSADAEEWPALPASFFDFIEVDVEDGGQEAAPPGVREDREDSSDRGAGDAGDGELLEFQLFAGSEPASVSLAVPKEETMQGRSMEYYIFKPSADRRRSYALSAVSGTQVAEEAAFWQRLAAQRPAAPDINSGFVAQRRKCRPGKQARLNKRLKNERLDRERKEAQERFKNRRKGFQFRRGPNNNRGPARPRAKAGER